MENPEEILKYYIIATNTHDFQNVIKVLHPKAVYWFSDRTCTTLEEIGQYFELAWETVKEEKYSISDIQWLAQEEKLASCIYHYHYEGYINGRFVNGGGRATNIFLRDEHNRWKITHEHLSSFPR